MSLDNEILFYETNDGGVSISVKFEDEDIWLNQKQMAQLFDCSVDNIALHLKNIYSTGELDQEATSEQFSVVAEEGNRTVKRQMVFYNLDAIIAVGYRVNSKKATNFRIWATKILKEFIIKGFVLDSSRLKNGSKFGHDYFEELLERIKDIRASERRFYQKITDIYAQCSADYDSKSEITKNFYAKIQNKLHFAIHGETAAQIIHSRADHAKPYMGLSTWKNGPNGKILKSDTFVAKNYLNEDEIKKLNHIVSMYLDYAQLQASKHQLMTMEDWALKLDSFLSFNEMNILDNIGNISADFAKSFAQNEYEKYQKIQDKIYKSDFDQLHEQISLIKDES